MYKPIKSFSQRLILVHYACTKGRLTYPILVLLSLLNLINPLPFFPFTQNEMFILPCS